MIFTATCKLGLEALVAAELRKLSIEVVRVEDAHVLFKGDYQDMARAVLWLRTAERVLLEVGSFEARTFDELFEGTKALPWKSFLARDTFIHVTGKSAKSALFSVSDCQSIVKKAIVENLKSAYRTDVLPETGRRVIVEVGLLRDTATLALDCCGAGLSRRGYRTYNVAAPIAETLGAAIVTLSRYYADIPLIDPMCGSGTMPIEAAMLAQNRAPGLNRPFAAEEWPFFDRKVMERVREEARDAVKDVKLDILGSDIDARSIDLCKKHAQKAGVHVNWAIKPLKEFSTNQTGSIVVCNPPYGERLMEKKEAEALYREMRQVFLPQFIRSVNIITSHPDFERIYGLRADKRRKLSNGGKVCMLYQYFVKS